MKNSTFIPSNSAAKTFDTQKLRPGVGPIALRITMLLILSIPSPAAQAGTYLEKTLHSFTGGTTDGANPFAHLTYVNAHGSEMLFGTTYNGGSNKGTVFSIDPTKSAEETVHQFTGVKGDGALPYAGLTEYQGMLYGTTMNGGMSDAGTVFSIDPWSGNAKTLYSFTGTKGDGAFPNACLMECRGLLYGTTANGGSNVLGTVFSINPRTRQVKTLHSFTGGHGDGAVPYACLMEYNDALYGTTYQGGTENKGTVFSLDLKTGHEATLHSFTGAKGDGALPYASLMEDHGMLYGTTLKGGTANQGIVFVLDPATGHENTVYQFSGTKNDGSLPNASLIKYNGMLVGTTYQGGTHKKGTVFSIDPANGHEIILYNFSGADGDGASPNASLTALHGKLYGTTYSGGTANRGTVFTLDATRIGPLPYAALAGALAPLAGTGTGDSTGTGTGTGTGGNTGSGTGTGTGSGGSTGTGTGSSTGTGTGTGTNTGTGTGTSTGVVRTGPHPTNTPEPSSWVAFGIGGLGLFFLSLRARRTPARQKTRSV